MSMKALLVAAVILMSASCVDRNDQVTRVPVIINITIGVRRPFSNSYLFWLSHLD